MRLVNILFIFIFICNGNVQPTNGRQVIVFHSSVWQDLSAIITGLKSQNSEVTWTSYGKDNIKTQLSSLYNSQNPDEANTLERIAGVIDTLLDIKDNGNLEIHIPVFKAQSLLGLQNTDDVGFSLLKDRGAFTNWVTSSKSIKRSESESIVTSSYDSMMRNQPQSKDKNEIVNRMKLLDLMANNVEFKKKHWDASITKHFGVDYKTQTSKFHILQHLFHKFKANYVDVNSDDKISELASGKRADLIKEKWSNGAKLFDLQTYLYAAEKNAIVFTSSTESFLDIEYPIYFNHFKNVKLFHPLLSTAADITQSQKLDITWQIESAITDDLSDRSLQVLSKIRTSNGLPSNQVVNILKKVGEEVLRFKSNINLKGFLNCKHSLKIWPVFDALSYFTNNAKLSAKTIFSTSSEESIIKAISALGLLRKLHFGGTLTPNNFEMSSGQKLSVGQVLKYVVDALLTNAYVISTSENDVLLKFVTELNKDKHNFAILQKLFLNMFLLMNYEQHIIQSESKSFDNDNQYSSIAFNNAEKEDDDHKDGAASPSDAGTAEEIHKRARIKDKSKAVWKNAPKEPKSYFKGAQQFSIVLNIGLLTKDILNNLHDGNYLNVAINVGGFMGGNVAGVMSEVLKAKGLHLVEAGKHLSRSKVFLVSSPFLAAIGIPFAIYDLVQQINSFNEGNTGAIVDIIAASINLAVGITGLCLGIFAALGMFTSVAAAFGPIGAAIGLAVTLAVMIYKYFVDVIEQTNNVGDEFGLSTENRVLFGFYHIFSPSKVKDAEELVAFKKLNKEIVQDGMKVLNENNNFKAVYMPSAAHKERNKEHIKLTIKRTTAPTVEWSYEGYDIDPNDGEVFCAPPPRPNIINQFGLSLTNSGPIDTKARKITHVCHNAIGVRHISNQNPDAFVLFNLQPKEDVECYATVEGSVHDKNYFIIGNGVQNITGGNKNDLFFIKHREVQYLNDRCGISIDGGGGENSLDVDNATRKRIMANFTENILYWARRKVKWHRDPMEMFAWCPIKLNRIQQFFGRKEIGDSIVASTQLTYINGRGGYKSTTENAPDIIEIPEGASYNLTILLNSHTNVVNRATGGEFRYIVTGTDGMNVFSYPHETLSRIHQFIVYQTFANLYSIQKMDEKGDNDNKTFTLMLTFNDKSTIAFALNMKNILLVFNDSATINVQESGYYAIVKTSKSISEVQSELLDKAIHLNMTILIQNEKLKGSIVAGNKFQSTFQNDPNYHTIIRANGGDMSHSFKLDAHVECKLSRNDPILKSGFDVEIFYSNSPTSNTAIDFKKIAKKVQNCYGKQLMLLHVIYDKRIDINLWEDDIPKPRLFMKTQLRNIANPRKYLEKLTIAFNGAAVQLKSDDKHTNGTMKRTEVLNSYRQADHMTPLPLTFDAGHNMIYISHGDVEINSKIIVKHTIGTPVWVKFKSDLLLTNMNPNEKSKQTKKKAFMIWFRKFNEISDIIYTIELNFNVHVTIALNEERKNIEDAPHHHDYVLFRSHFDEVDFTAYDLKFGETN